jgi:2-methylcitrate dehydratase PrpD
VNNTPAEHAGSDRDAVITAVDALGQFAAELTPATIPPTVRTRLELMLVDLVGVTATGAATPEFAALLDAWSTPAGDAPILGTNLTTVPETAALLGATAACMLELDEGNKHAQGHPAVQVVFAALAAAQLRREPVSGDQLLVAIAAGYEVAARLGRALRRDPLWHTHGHWGAAGAACAAALIGGAGAAEISGAIDSAAGLMTITPWAIVLAGDFTRNLWVGSANVAGLNAARLARAGLVGNTGALHSVLGTIVGSLDADDLVRGLGRDWLVTEGYGKLHSSCSYTHVGIDIVQQLRRDHPFTPADVRGVRVGTHSLARPLFPAGPANRLAAMFSFPFVMAAAIINDRVDPAAMDPTGLHFAEASHLAELVRMEVLPDFDARLPLERWTSVDIDLVDGRTLSGSEPNPIGDADHAPLGGAEIDRKLQHLMGTAGAAAARLAVQDIVRATDVVAALSSAAAAVAGRMVNFG